jgi:superfamily II DNA or RNA helicase
MSLDNGRLEIQKKALNTWLQVGKGTLEISTGVGKTFIFLMACAKVANKIKKPKVLFLAERTDREYDLKKDIKKFKQVFGIDINTLVKLEFSCYQSAYKWKNTEWDLVGADEIHNSLSPTYFQFYENNKYKYLMGLSATIDRNTSYDIDGKIITKGMLLDKIAPVCFTYGLTKARKDNNARDLNIIVIEHQLDNKDVLTLEGGSSGTEQQLYDAFDRQFKRVINAPYSPSKTYYIQNASRKRAEILYNLPSKTRSVMLLKHGMYKISPTKTLLFGNSLDALELITENVISSRNTPKKNITLRHQFDNNKIKFLAAWKKLEQGANLEGIENLIIMSYYSKPLNIIQRLGRLRNKDTAGTVFIYRCKGTQEEVWFDRMLENVDRSIYNFIYVADEKEALAEYKKIKNARTNRNRRKPTEKR